MRTARFLFVLLLHFATFCALTDPRTQEGGGEPVRIRENKHYLEPSRQSFRHSKCAQGARLLVPQRQPERLEGAEAVRAYRPRDEERYNRWRPARTDAMLLQATRMVKLSRV